MSRETNKLPYSLYQVDFFKENKHADTVFLVCTNGRYFAVEEKGFCNSGELLLAKWDGSKLGALYKVLRVENRKVITEKCIKGFGSDKDKEVLLKQVEDHTHTKLS